MKFDKLQEYTLIKEQSIPDIASHGYLLLHKKSRARIMILENEDENKVFNIAFRTPPADSTGVAHILEHSVLCGSRKYPLKDPFVELVKGSLNTFLNAMTYPDKTMYPVASCNDQDFKNLMDVYLDAVFYPNIYQHPEIFQQEGWHYELEAQEEPLTCNGVVYNEMKGAFSSPEEMLEREIFNTLFPDTPYGVESGGDPEDIPNLTYEQFLEFHRNYYHPSNSYIYLYGNLDMEERLLWLDREYLSAFEAKQVDSAIALQEPFEKPTEKIIYYPIADHETGEQQTYLTWNVSAGNSLDVELNMAFQMLEYALLSAPGAPLKKALLDAGIGKDIIGSYEDGILQPFFSVIAKNARAGEQPRFLETIRTTLEKLVREGIDVKSLEAGINYYEFRFREADYASYPKGLMYGLDVFSSWLYDDDRAFDYLMQLEIFASLKKKIGSNYFEQLIQEYFLDNTHGAIVTAMPLKGLARKREEETAKKLADYRDTLSEAELLELESCTHALREYQSRAESPEAMASIPMLRRSDIGRKGPKLYNEMRSNWGIPILFHELPTNGIAYLTLLFNAKGLPEELIPYMSLLKSVLGYVDTERYCYGELFNEINANSGGIQCGMHVLTKSNEPADTTEGHTVFFGVKAKGLYSQLDFVFDMIREILGASRLDDEKRLYEILAQQKSRLQMSLPSAGHASAVSRLASYYSVSGCLQETISGIGYYRFIEELEENFESCKAEIIARLKRVIKYLFRTQNLMLNYTAEEAGYTALLQADPGFSAFISEETVPDRSDRMLPEKKNEAFKTSGQVQYVAQGGSFKQAGFAYHGSMQILKQILSYDYLWNNLRVKGGAYGCMCAFKRTGESFLVSYRDPKLEQTLEAYRGIPEYLRGFCADEREMTKYIIGTISGLDTPLTAQGKGILSFNAYFSGITEAELQREREEILNAEPQDIRNLAEMVEAVLAQNNLCVIGSESAIEEQKDKFMQIKHLIGA